MSQREGGPRRQSPATRKLYVIRDEIGLTDSERIALSQYLLRRDITSWKQLDEHQTLRLLDAMEGYQLITELIAQRPPAD